MKFIVTVLLVSALMLVVYPIWGLVDPTTFLQELVEQFPLAENASSDQVRRAAYYMLVSNGVLVVALLLLVQFITRPERYRSANWGAVCLFAYPFAVTAVEVVTAMELYAHLSSAPFAVEFSSTKAMFLLFSMVIFGVSVSQQRCKHAEAL